MLLGMPNCASALDSLSTIRLRAVVSVFGIAAIITLACGEPPPTEPEPSPTPTPTPTTITLDRTSATLDALGATQQLTATVRDRDNKAMVVTITWSSSNDDVASVSSSGLVTAEGNGTTSITATHAALEASATVTVQQKVDSYQDVVGDGQTAVVTQALADSLGITVLDRLGNPVEGLAMQFQNLAEGSVVSPNPATSDSQGRVRAEWTLGRTAGIQSADAHREGDGGVYSFYANALPDVVDSLVMIGGDSQLGIPGERLYTNLYVATTDRFGNAITGQEVDFVVTSGGGTIDPTTRITGPNGAVADDRLAGLADSLTMTSWNLSDIMGSLGSAAQLAPATFGFAEFSELRIVRAGGTSYTVVSSDVPHSALAIKVRHQNGIEASMDLRPMLWVMRTR
jgi:hypothetical protein